MHNTSLIPVKWAGECSSLASALSAEVSTWCHSEMYLCLIFLTNAPPALKNRHTHTQTDSGVTHPSLFPTPTLSSPSPPLPTQACDVTVSDNEVRFLLHQSVGMTAAQASMVPGALCCGLTDCSQSPSAVHFKVGDQGLTCAWHPGNDNASASLHLLLRAGPRDTKTCRLLPHYFAAWRKFSFRRGDIHTGRGQWSMCILYAYWWVKGRGRTAEETEWQQILGAVLFDCWSNNW